MIDSRADAARNGRDPTARPRRTMTLPSADEFLTGVSKHAHGSVDGLEDSENKKIDWRAVGAGLRHYLRRDRAVTLAPAGVPRPLRRRLLRTR